MSDEDFVLTILSEDEASILDRSSGDEASVPTAKTKKRKRNEKESDAAAVKQKAENKRFKIESEDEIASDFEFDLGGDVVEDFDGWGEDSRRDGESLSGDRAGVSIYELVSQRKLEASLGSSKQPDEGDDEDSVGNGLAADSDADQDEMLAADGFGMGAETEHDASATGLTSGSDDCDQDSDQADPDAGQPSHGQSLICSPDTHPMDLVSDNSEDDQEDNVQARRRAAFFAPEHDGGSMEAGKKPTPTASFFDMGLSRPILKGLGAIGFNKPTPIQRQAIPVALAGKDVVGGAVTGSGKTAAFLIPILERLIFRPKKVPSTRVAILMPTRELAVQCYNVATKMAVMTDVTFAQIVGGYSVREQEQTLRRRPDVIIATPGRFIDHMRNSSGFAIETLEILVLDEADRMLEDGFADELNEILKTIPKSRQTMLFSATMTEDVDKLIRVGMRRPVRLFIDAQKQTVSGLVQEFVRLRPGKENKRLAYLMWLCQNIYTDRVIIFFRQKKDVHRILVIFALCQLQAAELHGGITQEQRIQAVESFRSGKASFLLSTDLASRGLDIKNVNAVINYEAPQSHEIYLHRVGRTARAGRSGRACTLAAESDRKVVKDVVRTARKQGAKIASRTVPPDAADLLADHIASLNDEIEAILTEEKELRALNIAERDIKKGENMIIHEHEIKSRPKRTWFENEQKKQEAKERGRLELNGHPSAAVPISKGKLSNKQKKKLDAKAERTEHPFSSIGKTKANRGKNMAQLKASSKLGKSSKKHNR